MLKKTNKLKRISLSMCFVFLVSGSNVFGAPSVQGVSGVISDGEKLTVAGAGFGSHDDYDGAAPYLNYLFEDGEAGVIDAASKGWSGWASMTTSNNRIGSSYNVFHERRVTEKIYTTVFNTNVTSTYRYGIKVDVQNTAPVHNYFISQWIRLSDDFGNISASSGNQVKLLMTTPYNNIGGKDYFQTRGDSTPPLRTESESGQLSQQHGPIEDYMPYGTWHRMDMWVSVPDSTTGDIDEIKWWIDGKLIREGTQLGFSQTVVNKVGIISYIGYIDNTSDVSFSLQTDDHFLDFTMARVEISDSPVWDDTVQAHKEIQLPTNWSDSSIDFEANLSSFPAGAPLYVYVVDSTGAVNSSGFLLSGNNSSQGQPLEKVQGFEIIQ